MSRPMSILGLKFAQRGGSAVDKGLVTSLHYLLKGIATA